MCSQAERDRVADLLAAGLNDCAIARVTDIPRSTVRDWRRGKRPRRSDSVPGSSSEYRGDRVEDDALGGPYGYLLGLYLGDGCLSEHRRGVFRLRVTLDIRYPGIVRECGVAMRQLCGNRVCVQPKRRENAVEVSTYSKQLPWRVMNAWNISVARRESVARLDEFVGPKT